MYSLASNPSAHLSRRYSLLARQRCRGYRYYRHRCVCRALAQTSQCTTRHARGRSVHRIGTISRAYADKGAEPLLSSFADPARLTSTIYRLATGEDAASEKLLQFFYAASLTVMEQFSGVQLAQICWSLACLEVSFPQAAAALGPEEVSIAPPAAWCDALMSRLPVAVTLMPPEEAVATIWALACMSAEVGGEVMEAALNHLGPAVEGLDDDNLCRIMYALTRLEYPYSEAFAEEVVIASVGRMRKLTGPQLGIIGYGLARRGFRPAERWLEAYTQVGIMTPDYSADSISDVAYALAVFKVTPPEDWVLLMYTATMDPQRCSLATMSPAAMTDLLWSLAILQYRRPPEQWYDEYLAYLIMKIEYLSADDFVRWLWAMGTLDFKVEDEQYAMQLLLRANTLLAQGELSPQDLAYVVKGCNMMFLGDDSSSVEPEGEKPIWLEVFYREVFTFLDREGGWQQFRMLNWDVPPGLPIP